MRTPLDEIARETMRLFRPPARTAEGRAVAALRAETRLLAARMVVERSREAVRRAQLVLARRRRDLMIARTDRRDWR